MEGLISLRRPEQVAKLRGLSVNQVLGIEKNGKNAKLASEGEGGDSGAGEEGTAQGGRQAAEGGSAGASDEVAVDAEVPAATPEPEPADTGREAEDVGGGAGSVA
jgi:hypothetical protein